MRNKMVMALMLVGMALLSTGCAQKETDPHLKDYSVLNPSKDFTLHDQDGKVFNLKDHRGSVIVLFFGYISCPDICPITISKMARVYKILKDSKQKILTVFVTVDPERDTPARLKEYLEYFNINAVGLTGSKAEIDAVVGAYKGVYEKVESDSAMGYLFNHSDHLYLIDGTGTVRALFHHDDKAEDIAQSIRSLGR